MFSRRLLLAIGFLALLFCGHGALSWWVTGEAEQRVVRGRIAADIRAGFLDLTATKQKLRAWSLQALLGASPPPAEGDALSRDLIATTDGLVALSVYAEQFDRARGEQSAEHRERAEALAVLGAAFRALRGSVLGIDPALTPSDPIAAWSALAKVFDVAGDGDLRSILDASIQREAVAIERKRQFADASLARIKQIALTANASLVLTALLLAAYLALSLRRPLTGMTEGAQALERGDLDYRMQESASDEFGQFARSVNRMASELQERRRQERLGREQLEKVVSEKTIELQTALADLQNSEARRRQLISEISHELRTPTTAIRGEAEVALRGREKPAAEYREALERIGETAIQLGDVINDLLTIARSDVDALTIESRLVDLAMAARRSIQQASGNAALRDVRIDARIEDSPVLVMGDATRLQQLIGLIVDNAIRYSHQGGLIRVRLDVLPSHEGACARVVIEDDGIGISKQDQDLIFDRHFRSAAARRHRPDGTGLGLSIASVLASLHNASIDVQSEPGHGANVTIVFPLATADVPEPA